MDTLSASAYRIAWAAIIARAFAQWEHMPPAVWCEEVRRMPGGRRFKWSYAPYLRKMFESIFDPVVQATIFQLFSRAGKSEVILNSLGYCIDKDPRHILCLWPTVGQAEKWSKDNLGNELIEETPSLTRLLGNSDGKRRPNNTILHKIFPGGLINIFGSNSPGEMRRAKGNFLNADEIDAIVESETDEGDQLTIFNKRGDEYPDTIRVFSSYPSLKGKSRIAALMEESDYQQYLTTCLICGGEPWAMTRRQLRYEPDKPAEARLECPKCHDYLTDSQRHSMMLQGNDSDLWVPTKPFTGKRGFQASAMLWPHPTDPAKYPGGFLQMVAQQEIDAEKSQNPERARRVIVNTVDAETYAPPQDAKADSSQLYGKREAWNPEETIPAGVLVATAGVDIQGNRAAVKVKGYGLNGETWALWYYEPKGSPLAPQLWDKLDKFLLNFAALTEDGREIRISATGIDSGHCPDEVYKFVRQRWRRRVYAMKGSAILSKPIITKPSNVGKLKVPLYMIGTNEAKDVIYQRLDLLPVIDPKTSVATYPHGYMHFPTSGMFDEAYFKGLTVENSQLAQAPNGEFYRAFFCPDGARNEPLDCEVYADAACRILNPQLKRMAKALVPAEEPPAKPAPRKYTINPRMRHV